MLMCHLDVSRGKYVVFDRESGEVLIPPFFSHVDPAVLARRLAASVRRPVDHVDVDGRVLGRFSPDQPAMDI